MRTELVIDGIAAGGDGVGRHEGLVVFVPRTAPGDRALVEFEMHGRLGRGQLISLLEEGPGRAEPGCRHYIADKCGGCQLQHLEYGRQRAAKAGIIRDALERIGGRALDPPAVEESPRQWRYRTKLTLALRRRGDGWIGGLHPYDDPGAVFALDDCPITSEDVVDVWREILAGPAPLPEAAELRGAVRLDEGGAVFMVEGGRRWMRPRALLDAVPRLRAIWWARERERPRLVAERGGSTLGASFSQVNPAVAERVRAAVLERVLAVSPRTVIDAYAGSGATAVPLAERGITVTAIERDRAAARHTGRALREPSRSLAAPVEDALAPALPADAVILNPPRGGVHPGVADALEAARPRSRAIVYVSCNPATLARDLRRLPSWEIASLQAFDMFPQTAHVETVCVLRPAA